MLKEAGTIFRQILRGAQEHPWRTLMAIGICYSVLWTLTESLTSFFPVLGGMGIPGYTVLVLLSVLGGLIYNRKRSKVRFRVPSTNTVLSIEFGDLWTSDGVRVIPVNEYFDSALGDHVAERSLHGQFIRRCLGGYSDQFERLVDESLKPQPRTAVPRTSGRTNKFALGTTAVVSVNGERHLLVAAACTDIHTLKARCSVPEFWSALDGLWDTARNTANGEPVVLPLIGSGQGGVPLAPEELLRFTLLSAVSASRKERITSAIRIILPITMFEDVSLTDLSRGWS